MALNGEFYGTTSNSRIDVKLVWSAKQSISGNYSEVSAILTYSRNNSGYTTEGTWSGGITINGTRTPHSQYIKITHNSDTVAMSTTTRVYHKSDGTQTLTISADGGIADSSLTSTSISGTATLNMIPKDSQITVSADPVEFGKSVVISTNRASTSFTHTLYYKYGDMAADAWYLLKENVGASYTWTIPKSLMEKIPNETSLKITLGCDTYQSGTFIGRGSDIVITAIVPDTTDCYPTIEAISWTKQSNEPSDWPMTQGVSKGKLDMLGQTGAWGSTITSYSLTFAGLSSTVSYLQVDNIASSGDLKAIAKVTDSRGRSYTKEKTFSVTAYSKPKITAEVYRCNSSGVENAEGDYIRVLATAEVTSMGGKNSLQSLVLQLKKLSDASYGSPINLTPGVAMIIEASNNYTWDWLVTATDKVHSSTNRNSESTGEVVLDILANGKGIAFGKVAEKDGFDSAWPFMLNGYQLDYTKSRGVVGSGDNITVYETYESGKSIIYGKIAIYNMTTDTSYGSGFYTDSNNLLSWPEGMFIEPPAVFLSVCGNGLRSAMAKEIRTSGVDLRIFDVGQITSDAVVSYFAIGRWK